MSVTSDIAGRDATRSEFARNNGRPPAEPPSRLAVVWRGKWIVALVAIVFAVVAGGYAALRPTTYQADATVQVSLLQTANAGEQNALAANELAAQYSQLAESAPVVALAKSRLGGANYDITADVSASPINNYNVVGITATGSSSTRVGLEASAVANALVSYLTTQQQRAVLSANSDTAGQLKSLDKQISQLQTEIAADAKAAGGKGTAATRAAASLPSERSLLASLLNNRASTYTGPQREFLQSQPVLTVTSTPTHGSAQASNAVLYALGGLLVGLVVAAELLVLRARLRDERRVLHREPARQ